MNRRFIVVLLGLAPILWGVWEWPLASYRGELNARLDVSRGYLVVLGYGLPSMSRPEYESLLKARYGIEYKAVAGCIVSQTTIAYVDGYDRVSMAAAKGRFGSNIFSEASADAEAQARRMHPEYYRVSTP